MIKSKVRIFKSTFLSTAKTFTLLLVLGAAFSLDLQNEDPNNLSCDSEGQTFLLLPHYEDCSKFYMCSHGEEVEFSCAPGTIFDFLLQTCNHEWATKCWLRDVESLDEEEGSGDEEGSGEGSGDFESSSSSRFSSHMSTFAARLDCNDARDAARMVPFMGDCQRYWRCVNGLPVSAFCSDGLFFNEGTMQCDFEANVRCTVHHDEELNGEYMIFE